MLVVLIKYIDLVSFWQGLNVAAAVSHDGRTCWSSLERRAFGFGATKACFLSRPLYVIHSGGSLYSASIGLFGANRTPQPNLNMYTRKERVVHAEGTGGACGS